MSDSPTLAPERAEVMGLCLALLESPLLDRIEAVSEAWHPDMRAMLVDIAAWARRSTVKDLAALWKRDIGDAAIVVCQIDDWTETPAGMLLSSLRWLLDVRQRIAAAVQEWGISRDLDVNAAAYDMRGATSRARLACEAAGIDRSVFDATLADARQAARSELGASGKPW